jgi:fatty acid desaturase
MASHSSLRASDADRDAVAERLRHAAAEGRLEPEELEERLHTALRARTYGDLRRLLTDLPAKPMAWERRRAEAMPAAGIALAVAMRVVLALAVVAIVLIVAVVMAASWILWAIVWLVLCGHRSRIARLGARSAWHRPPRARGVQRRRLAGLR